MIVADVQRRGRYALKDQGRTRLEGELLMIIRPPLSAFELPQSSRGRHLNYKRAVSVTKQEAKYRFQNSILTPYTLHHLGACSPSFPDLQFCIVPSYSTLRTKGCQKVITPRTVACLVGADRFVKLLKSGEVHALLYPASGPALKLVIMTIPFLQLVPYCTRDGVSSLLGGD